MGTSRRTSKRRTSKRPAKRATSPARRKTKRAAAKPKARTKRKATRAEKPRPPLPRAPVGDVTVEVSLEVTQQVPVAEVLGDIEEVLALDALSERA